MSPKRATASRSMALICSTVDIFMGTSLPLSFQQVL
jgi:hypothetical protein